MMNGSEAVNRLRDWLPKINNNSLLYLLQTIGRQRLFEADEINDLKDAILYVADNAGQIDNINQIANRSYDDLQNIPPLILTPLALPPIEEARTDVIYQVNGVQQVNVAGSWVQVGSKRIKEIRTYYPTIPANPLNTWYSWTRNASTMLTQAPNQPLGTGTEPNKIGTWFGDTNFLIITDVSKLKKFTFCSKSIGFTIQLLVFKADFSQIAGNEPNGQYIINETISSTNPSLSSFFKDDFNIAEHTLSSKSIIQIFYRNTFTTNPTKGVQFIMEFE